MKQNTMAHPNLVALFAIAMQKYDTNTYFFARKMKKKSTTKHYYLRNAKKKVDRKREYQIKSKKRRKKQQNTKNGNGSSGGGSGNKISSNFILVFNIRKEVHRISSRINEYKFTYAITNI